MRLANCEIGKDVDWKCDILTGATIKAYKMGITLDVM